jgi:hypothetical protein
VPSRDDRTLYTPVLFDEHALIVTLVRKSAAATSLIVSSLHWFIGSLMLIRSPFKDLLSNLATVHQLVCLLAQEETTTSSPTLTVTI